jgi:Ser/Thr protein kinase RdoA (MazF antagonist)
MERGSSGSAGVADRALDRRVTLMSSRATPDVDAEFSAAVAERALRVACDVTGLDDRDADLIRLGENALFRLSSQPVVVRIARTMEYWADAVKEVAVAHWLAEHQFPAAQVHEVPEVRQPVRAGEYPVTFWRFIPGRPGARGEVRTLGLVLHRLHRMPRPSTFDLPPEDTLGRFGRRIESAPVSAADKEFLLYRVEELRSELSSLRYPLSPAAIHGDAWVENLMVCDNQPILIDFERFAWGQPEWDLAQMATEYQTAGWFTHAEYSQFVDAYGYDVMSWKSGFDVLRAAHEMQMTTWIMQRVNESPEIAQEYEKRMRTIRGVADSSDRWCAF